MYFIETAVASNSYHKGTTLTYGSPQPLEIGQIVVVPLRGSLVTGLVMSCSSTNPGFATKEVAAVPPLPALPKQLIELFNWVKEYYPAPLGLTTQLFLAKELPSKLPESLLVNPLSATSLPTLTTEQATALASINDIGMHLLHGETGSGKTRVYIELALKNIGQGKSVIILTPEIGLTSQLLTTFQPVFGNRVITVHSGLTLTSKRSNWLQILRQDEPLVIIGARSALFAPLKNIGLIVVDESHEPAYKQDQAPYYHTNLVAAKLAKIHGCTLILGSATPLVADYYVAAVKKRPILRMVQAAAGKRSQQKPQIIDIKNRANFTKSSTLSKQLIEATTQALNRKEQVLLFLNRRGTARVIFCQNCGWQANCPHCDLPLIYHKDSHAVRCHSCSFTANSPMSCPSCKQTDIIYKSVGTKAIYDEATRLFPEAKIMRFDTDNKKTERLEHNYADLKTGDVDIIVGTQTIAKGLDLPRLGLVGVIIADSGLFFPDFSAKERTYQLLSQVLGRVGRGHLHGHSIIQTYAPDSPLLQAIVQHKWDIFYNTELKERQQFMFPPFCYLLKLTCARATSSSAQKSAMQLFANIKGYKYNIKIEGPAPGFHERVNNKYEWQIIVKSKQREFLTQIVSDLPSGWRYDIDPINLL